MAPFRLAAGLLLALAVNAHAHAQPRPPDSPQVQLNGTLGSRAALLIIDGEPRTLEVGSTAKGVRLVAIEDGRAVIDVGGRREALSLGAAPARVGVPSGASRLIVMSMGQGGHYTTPGTINGQLTSFLLDTGATTVTLSQTEADRLGIRYATGKRVATQTANGTVPAFLINLASVRVGDVEVRDVNAIVIPSQMPHILLGNSFLNRFQMRRENDVMTLELRY